ncbi:MAG: helix-turn-helix domain-containing protein [Bilifractor sp.]
MTGEVIRNIRISLGLSRKEFAEKLGVSPSTIGMYEQNRRVPSSRNLQKIAELAHLKAGDILNGEIAVTQDSNSEKEENMLQAFRKLSPDEQDIIIGKIKEMLRENSKYPHYDP